MIICYHHGPVYANRNKQCFCLTMDNAFSKQYQIIDVIVVSYFYTSGTDRYRIVRCRWITNCGYFSKMNIVVTNITMNNLID